VPQFRSDLRNYRRNSSQSGVTLAVQVTRLVRHGVDHVIHRHAYAQRRITLWILGSVRPFPGISVSLLNQIATTSRFLSS